MEVHITMVLTPVLCLLTCPALVCMKTPLIFLVFSSLLNIVLDIVFILPFSMGVSGAAWATVLSQLLSALLCTLVGVNALGPAAIAG